MKILVVGGSGFIGRNFINRISLPFGGLRTPYTCYATYNTSVEFPASLSISWDGYTQAVKVDLLRAQETTDIMKSIGNKFDVCLYAMGNSDIGKSCKDPDFDIKMNINALLNLIQSIYVKKFIFISSGAVYEGHKGLVNPTLPVNPTIPYAINKLMSERYIDYFQKHTDHIDNYLCLRFFGAYGPLELPRKIYTNLVKAFHFDKKNEYVITGDGKNYIDAMYVDDMTNALVKMVESDKGNKILDFCFGRPLTINELVMKAARVFSIEDLTLKHNGTSSEYTTFYASSDEIKALFGFAPCIGLGCGLKDFSDYLSVQENLCRN